MSLTVNLINQSGQSEVYFMFGGGNAPNGTHNGEKLVYGKSYSIPSATKKATVELTSFISGKIFFSFGSITLSGPNPGFQPGSGQDSTIRWDKVELTLIDNPTAVSQLNLTAADFFSIPLKAEVLKSGVSHQPSLTWQNPPTVAQIFSKLASFSSNSSKAVVTGSGGVSVPNIGDVLRVISPSTVALPNPYVSFEPYLDYVKKHKISSLLEGEYNGLSSIPSNSPLPDSAYSKQTYKYTATINSSGDIVLTGSGSVVGNTTVTISASNASNGLYTANAPYSVSGNLTAANVYNSNSVFDTVLTDIYAGLNIGLVGSDVADPRPAAGGKIYQNENSSQWFAVNKYASWGKLTSKEIFAHAQPNNLYYNQYAAYLASITQAYGFPYTDKIAAPLLNIGANDADTLNLYVLPST